MTYASHAHGWHLAPTSDLGRLSLRVLVVAVVAGFVPPIGIPLAVVLGSVSWVQAVIAVTRRHDRGALLALPIVIGALPALFILGEIFIGHE